MSSRTRRTLAAAVTLTTAAMTLTACFEEPSPHDAVRDFLVGWQREDYELAASRTDGDPAVVRKALANAKLDLDAASFRFKIKSIKDQGGRTDAAFTAEVDLGENNPLWAYDGVLPMHLVDGRWKVRWSPSVLHPQLHEGQRFAVDIKPQGRQPIQDRNGDPLQGDATLYVAGVTPSALKGDPAQVCAQLATVTGFAQDRLLSRVRSSPPGEFVPLATFGRTKFRTIEKDLRAIDGIVIHNQPQPVAPMAPEQIVGKVSALTAESEQRLGGPQRAGDSVGQSGLQQAYQDHLTGSTQTRVITLDLKSGDEAAELKSWPGRTNGPVDTTIDSSTQRAADAALADTESSALVAVSATSGEILAVSTKGLKQDKDALAGHYPAGTAFSIIAADALLGAGVKPSQKLPCPAERTVGGARFQQAALTTVPKTFTGNFATGCVTGLAALARRVPTADLTASAARYGIGVPWTLPLKSFSGEVPGLASDADKARAIAGQNVQVSPLSMALVAGAVAAGTWHPPLLVTNPASPDATAEVVPAKQPGAQPLAPEVRTTLTAMMRAGVTSGSAKQATAPGEPVYGIVAGPVDAAKPQSWFVGWQGDVAIAILAENADPAVLAGRFFTGLRSSQ